MPSDSAVIRQSPTSTDGKFVIGSGPRCCGRLGRLVVGDRLFGVGQVDGIGRRGVAERDRRVRFGEAARDDQLLDLAGAFVDLQDPRVAEQAVGDRQLAEVPVAAVDLQVLVGAEGTVQNLLSSKIAELGENMRQKTQTAVYATLLELPMKAVMFWV